MSAMKQTLVCPRCNSRVKVATARYFSRDKGYIYTSEAHEHKDGKLYTVYQSPRVSRIHVAKTPAPALVASHPAPQQEEERKPWYKSLFAGFGI